VNRQHSHIRLVARKLLTSRSTKVDEDRISAIIEALTEKMYSHGHAIGRKEAKELGLPVDYSEDKIEQLVWRLYEQYEVFLQLNEPLDAEQLFLNQQQDQHDLGNVAMAAIETTRKFDVFEANAIFRAVRNVPSNPQINVNLSLGLPPGLQPNQLPAQAQQILQQLISQVSQAIPQLVHQAIVQQSPIVGIEGKLYGSRWIDRTDEPE
jgi:hypothetical protein